MTQKQYTVTHVMADGTELDDITGYIIPDDNPVYEIFRKINEDRREELRKNGKNQGLFLAQN
ncbi:TPA: hypothetical protein ACHU7F_001127 [Streptococcus suis]|nr:hypothetical protein [Streptococcus suis]